MKCIRCNNLFDSSIPEINAECYGGCKTYACPLCGKLYVFTRIVKVDAVPEFQFYLSSIKRIEECDEIGESDLFQYKK